MKDLLFKVKSFFEKHYIKNRPILLGYSGGTDSSVLLDILIKLKNELSIDIHVAHIDHGWREESSLEAEKLKVKIEKNNLIFHLKKIEVPKVGNLEEACRKMRLDFFKDIYKKYDCQALLLVHQADDLAETVLKRFLEGANLANIGAMEPISAYEGMQLWRPLLFTDKSKITAYLKENGIEYIDDQTNYNEKFLRAKMRQSIFPELSRTFGKEIKNNLVRLSKYSHELKKYMDRKTDKVFQNILIGPFGRMMDLSEIEEDFELRHILKRFFFLEKTEVTSDGIDKMIEALKLKKAGKAFVFEARKVLIDRGYLFIIEKKTLHLDKISVLKEGSQTIGDLEIRIENCLEQDRFSDWKDFFLGNGLIYIPKAKYKIKSLEENRIIKKYYEKKKIPSFFWSLGPILSDDNGIFFDFLSGKTKKKNSGFPGYYKVSLKILK